MHAVEQCAANLPVAPSIDDLPQMLALFADLRDQIALHKGNNIWYAPSLPSLRRSKKEEIKRKETLDEEESELRVIEESRRNITNNSLRGAIDFSRRWLSSQYNLARTTAGD